MTVIESDYLIVGAGAAGMAFADELITQLDADVVIADRRHRPGGHWNDGYPFLRLHQPSAFYGVNSRNLGNDSIDTTGPNAGSYERATAVEICDYYQKVLDQQLLASGKVRFFGGCDYVGNWSGEHALASRLTGEKTTVRVRRKVVDATYLQSSVPGTHAPAFEVDPDARLIPVGELVDLTEAPSGYTILGAGKTAMDACNWLLDNGVDPDKIRWIKPRDSWVFDRTMFQPLDLLVPTMEGLSLDVEALAQASSVEDFFRRVEECGALFRVDRTVEPTMFKGAILSRAEREALLQVERVVRQGRVRHLGSQRIVLENGEIPADPREVHVDCTADGLPIRPERPIFEPGRITLQSLMCGQTTPAAAIVAFVESARDDDAEKNRLCPPIANPSEAIDWIRCLSGILRGFVARSSEPDITTWSDSSRLNLLRGMADHMGDPRMQSAMARWLENMEPAMRRGEEFLGQAVPAAGPR